MPSRHEEQQKEFDDQLKNWPVKRTKTDDITEEEKIALHETKKVWKLGVSYLSDEHPWKKEKENNQGKVQIFSYKCPELKMKLFKTTCEIDFDWKKVHAVLMDTEDNPNWNLTLELCQRVAEFPPPEDDKSCGSSESWITYMLVSQRTSKIISQRDFVSCFRSEVSETSATWIGRHCDVSLCPPCPKVVRAEQSIVVMHVEKTGDNRCRVTQVYAINFKGLILQSIIDSQMVKSQTNYAQNLLERIEQERSGKPGNYDYQSHRGLTPSPFNKFNPSEASGSRSKSGRSSGRKSGKSSARKSARQSANASKSRTPDPPADKS